MSRASSRLDQRKGRQMFRCQMSRFLRVQVTDGCCSSNERGNLDPTTLGVWKATRAATLEWGVVAHRRTFSHAERHACSHGRQKCPNWGDVGMMWVGARRLEGSRLGPISSGMPRRGGKSWGTTGDTWELGPRRYPFILIRCPSPTHCVLHHIGEQAD